MIKLEINRTEKNKGYKPPKNLSGIYRESYDIPEYSTFEVLNVKITEKQFEAIRKAVLEVF